MPYTATEDEKIAGIESPVQQDIFDTEYLKDDLKGRSVRGGAITIFSQGCKFTLHTVSTVVLARLLSPDDFGLIAMVTALTNFAMMFKDLGLSIATIQKPNINHDQISTLFWINVAVGVVIAVAICALAPAVAWFYNQPELKNVTMALSLSFVFGGLTVQHQALLRRHMRFFHIGVIEVSAMSIGVFAAIIAGLYRAGYWSLVIMHIGIALALAVGVWIAFPWLPGPPRKRAGVREMLSFGSNVTGFNLVNYFSRNADNILIGKFVGSAALGFYSKAYGLLMLPIRQIVKPISAVALPSLSRLNNNPQKYKNYYLKAITLITFITAPLIAFMFVMFKDIILLILGEQWLPASSIFAVLAISAFIQPLYHTQGWLHISSGHSKRYFRWGLIGSTIIVVSFLLGLPYGTIGVATAYTIALYAILVPCMWYAGNSANIKASKIFSVVWKNWCAAALGAAGCYLVLSNMNFSKNIPIRLTSGFFCLVIIYVVSIAALNRSLKSFSQFISLLKDFKPAKKESVQNERVPT